MKVTVHSYCYNTSVRNYHYKQIQPFIDTYVNLVISCHTNFMSCWKQMCSDSVCTLIDSVNDILHLILNSLCVGFIFRKHKDMFVFSFLNDEMVQIIEILSHGKQGSFHPTHFILYHGCWCGCAKNIWKKKSSSNFYHLALAAMFWKHNDSSFKLNYWYASCSCLWDIKHVFMQVKSCPSDKMIILSEIVRLCLTFQSVPLSTANSPPMWVFIILVAELSKSWSCNLACTSVVSRLLHSSSVMAVGLSLGCEA